MTLYHCSVSICLIGLSVVAFSNAGAADDISFNRGVQGDALLVTTLFSKEAWATVRRGQRCAVPGLDLVIAWVGGRS